MQAIPLLAALTCFLVPCSVAAPEELVSGDDNVQVGGRTLKVPAPAGFVRCDGIYPEWDRITGSMLPASNRMLAIYGTPADYEALKAGSAAPCATNCDLQVLRALENRELGEQTFADLRRQMKGEIQKTMDDMQRRLQQTISQANSTIKQDYGVEEMLHISDTAMLGFFEENDTALGFTMAMNVTVKAAAGETGKSRSVVAAIMAPVNGRLVFFYATVPFQSAADRTLAEQTVTTWRNAVVAANPRLAGPRSLGGWFDWTKVSRSALIGALVGAGLGGLAAILGALKLLKRKDG